MLVSNKRFKAASTPHLEGRNISAHRQQPPSGSYAEQISCSRKHTAAALGHYATKVERPDRARCRVRVHGRLRSMEQNFTGIAHTGITVRNLDDALAFWVGVLGFALERRFHLDGELAEGVTGVTSATIDVAVVSLGEQSVELLQYLSPPNRMIVRPEPCDVGSVHLALNVIDMDAAIEAASLAGWVPAGPPVVATHGPRAGTAFIYLSDQHGGTLEFIAAPTAAE
jgi:catechol 2,3-dioxygenase-like lactoylglutathione lyase family enzyme